jgi:hypothetical protein
MAGKPLPSSSPDELRALIGMLTREHRELQAEIDELRDRLSRAAEMIRLKDQLIDDQIRKIARLSGVFGG